MKLFRRRKREAPWVRVKVEGGGPSIFVSGADDPAAVGREIALYLRAYERSTGRNPVA